MWCSPHLILKHLISSVVSLAQLVSPSVALPAELVIFIFPYIYYPGTIELREMTKILASLYELEAVPRVSFKHTADHRP